MNATGEDKNPVLTSDMLKQSVLALRYPQSTSRIILMTHEERERCEAIYWTHLADKGWKQHIQPANGSYGYEMFQVVLVHEECGRGIECRTINTMGKEELDLITDDRYLQTQIEKHKASRKGCSSVEDGIDEFVETALATNMSEYLDRELVHRLNQAKTVQELETILTEINQPMIGPVVKALSKPYSPHEFERTITVRDGVVTDVRFRRLSTHPMSMYGSM